MITFEGNLVMFKFFKPQASAVFLIGDFNDWQIGRTPMTKGKDGYWTRQKRLPPGEYHFHYFADGEHYADYSCETVSGRHGFDSIARVVEEEYKKANSKK